jgi:hypothetical protein
MMKRISNRYHEADAWQYAGGGNGARCWMGIGIEGHRLLVRNGDLAELQMCSCMSSPGCVGAYLSPGQAHSLATLLGPPAQVGRAARPPPVRETDPRRMLGDLYSTMLRRLK